MVLEHFILENKASAFERKKMTTIYEAAFFLPVPTVIYQLERS